MLFKVFISLDAVVLLETANGEWHWIRKNQTAAPAAPHLTFNPHPRTMSQTATPSQPAQL
jgi:hypothetical protein